MNAVLLAVCAVCTAQVSHKQLCSDPSVDLCDSSHLGGLMGQMVLPRPPNKP